jgi:hypothetical protein
MQKDYAAYDFSAVFTTQTILCLCLFGLLIIILILLFIRRKFILLRFRHIFAVRKIARETKKKYRDELAKKSLERRQEQLKAREELIEAQMERNAQDRLEKKKQQETELALHQAALISREKEREQQEQERLELKAEKANKREAARLAERTKHIEERAEKQIARDAKKMEALKKAPVASTSVVRTNKTSRFLPFLKSKKQPRESRFFYINLQTIRAIMPTINVISRNRYIGHGTRISFYTRSKAIPV